MRLEVSRFDYWTIWLLWCLGKFPASGEVGIGMDKPVPIAYFSVRELTQEEMKMSYGNGHKGGLRSWSTRAETPTVLRTYR